MCQELANAKAVKLGGVDVDLSKDNFDFTIVLPKSLSDASVQGAKRFCKDKGVQDFEVKAGSRSFPFYVDSKLEEGRLIFYDFPTTLRASHEAVQLALSGPYIGYSEHHAVLDDKEINNFERTVRILLARPQAAEFRDNVKFLRLS